MAISQHSLPKYLQDPLVSKECKDLMSTLSKNRGWVLPVMYNYQGFWHSISHLQGVLSFQKHFPAQDTDIFVVTAPKSGTTWLKAISFAILNRTSYPITSGDHPLLKTNSHELVPFVEDIYADNPNPDFSSMPPPRLFATHVSHVSLPESVHVSKCKIVYMCRNPKDLFVSAFHFTNKLRLEHMGVNSIEEMFDLFCKGVSLYGPYWDQVLGYWNESLQRPKQVLFLKYEEMKEHPGTELRKLAEFYGCPITPKEEEEGIVDAILRLCSFETLSNLEVNKNGTLTTGLSNQAYFRRGEIGDWKNHLTAEMVEQLDMITEDKFHGSGLTF
ncbi:cytosolic sulfotransferase 12-like [Cynara cardunculus var. scolymus]|uniref:cytosolic sulfotransferase 12-like n=1 Tax=Cynara cardunculus var. scolymus TaxID=59895 RepID=UPI000D624507|nr:cytosolic sulfotransferase 12-like [Cynara cardunculus var. scolymus]